MLDIADEVLEIFKHENSNLDLSNFTIHDLIEDTGIDSFVFIQILACLEDYFDVEFSNSELLLENFKTIEDLAKIIERYLEHR